MQKAVLLIGLIAFWAVNATAQPNCHKAKIEFPDKAIATLPNPSPIALKGFLITMGDSTFNFLQAKRKSHFLIETEQLGESFLHNYYKNGFIHASLAFDTLIINNSVGNIYFIFHKGNQYKWGEVYLDGIEIKPSFLHHKYGYKQGEVYNYEKSQTLQLDLQKIPYFEIDSIVPIELENKTVEINIFGKPKGRNQFSGFAGFGQNAITKQTELTGQLNLKLHHSLKQHEEIKLNWDKNQASSQRINGRIHFPYVLNSPISAYFKLDIDKQDSTFTSSKYTGGLEFSTSNRGAISALLSKEGSTMKNTGNTNIDATKYGLGYSLHQLNDYWHPTKGFSLEFSVLTGNQNVAINENSRKNIQYEHEGSAKLYVPLFHNLLFAQISTGGKFADSLYLSNAFRHGGISSMRGFDQCAVFSHEYYITTLEYRWLIGLESELYVFQDFGYFALKAKYYEWKYAWGAGMRIASKAGIVNIAYAVGKTNQDAILFKQSKIHIGFTAVF
jgi:hypothetical protein